MYYKDITLTGPQAAIGYEDENLPARVIIDISDLTKYGTGTTVLEVKRPCDREAYIAEQTEVDGSNFYWYPTKGDLEVSGLLKCQVKAVIGDQIVKTRVYFVQVSGALNGDGTLSGVVPDALQVFVESASRSEDAAKASAEEAKKAEEAAKTSETNAASSATAAAESATASATSAGESEQNKTQAQEYAQNAYNSAVEAESAKDDAEDARDEIRSMRAEAVTLSPGSDATASYSDGLLSLGIPRGEKGDKGDTGEQGPKGDKGDPGEVTQAEFDSLSDTVKDKADIIVSSASGAIASFPDGAESTAKKLVVGIEPVQEGTGDPSPDNVRPISGFDSVKVWDDPKYGGTIKWNQLLSENQALRSYSKFGLTFAMIRGKMGFNVTGTLNLESPDRNAYIYGQDHPIAIIKDHVYCIAYVSKYATVYCYGAQFSGNWTGYAPHGGSIIKATNSANLNLSLKFGGNIPNGTVFNEEILINLFDLTEMFGKEKADEIYDLDTQSPRGQGVAWFKALFPKNYYEPDDSYTETCVSAVNGDPYRQVEVEFPSEAGTVYGGTLDVTSGVLTVDRAQIASYAGETLPSTWISDRDVYSAGATPTTGAQVVYELATPITYHLTPQEVRTLLGQNNIWADTGGMSVTYRADTKLYIDNKIAELQALVLEN